MQLITKKNARSLAHQLISQLSIQQLQDAGRNLLSQIKNLNLQQQKIAVFLSQEQEVDTSLMIKYLLNDNQLFIPMITDFKQRQMIMISLNHYLNSMLSTISLQDPSIIFDLSLQGYFKLNKWGIKEPITVTNQNQEIAQLDYILLPALAIDGQHNRLGYGKGFYDTYLAAYYQQWQNLPNLIAIVPQLLHLTDYQFVMEAHDIKIDQVITVKTNQPTYT